MARNVSPAAIPREISSRSLSSVLSVHDCVARAQYPLRLAGRGTGSWSVGLALWRCRNPSRQLYIGARFLRVLTLDLLHPLQLRDAHPAVLRLPVEVGRTADPMLPGQLAECDSGFAFLQDHPSRGSLRFRCGNTTTERPIFQTCGHGETDEDIVTRNSRRGSKFVRKTRQEGLLFAPTPRV